MKSSIFQPLRRYEPGWKTKPSAMIFKIASSVKITKKNISDLSYEKYVLKSVILAQWVRRQVVKLILIGMCSACMLLPTFLNQAVRFLMCEIKFLNRASQFLVFTKVVMEYTHEISTTTDAYRDSGNTKWLPVSTIEKIGRTLTLLLKGAYITFAQCTVTVYIRKFYTIISKFAFFFCFIRN